MATPIARYNVVPNQRISEVFNFGVVAFSKVSIENVSIAIAGQGYFGSTPLVSSEIALNPRTDVWEYFIEIDPTDFSGSGLFTATATITGTDAGALVLPAIPLVVDGASTLESFMAWVSTTGNDGTGEVGNELLPYLTIDGAVTGIQTSSITNVSDGATIYIKEGTFVLGNNWNHIDTSYEWLTIEKSAEAVRENAIINAAGDTRITDFIRFKDISLTQATPGDAWLNNAPDSLWLDGCYVYGSDRHVANTNVAGRIADNETDYPTYFTNCYIYNVDYGMKRGALSRNTTMRQIGNDAYANTLCIINAVVEDVDPVVTYWHADGYQSFGDGPTNRIIYGYHATDLHYQGLFIRQTVGNTADNNAFINMFIEMREPGREESAGGIVVLNAGTLNGPFDHLLMWNCSFLGGEFQVYDDPAGALLSFNNSSFIGNVFEAYIDFEEVSGTDPSYGEPENVNNNDFLENHYVNSFVDGTPGASIQSFSPDSDIGVSQSVGDSKIDLDTPGSAFYGYPETNSILLNRVTKITPVDSVGNIRPLITDIGALELKVMWEINETDTVYGSEVINLPISTGINISIGDLVVVVLTTNAGNTPNAVSDSVGNIYTLLTTKTGGASIQRMAYCIATNAGVGVIITGTYNSSQVGIHTVTATSFTPDAGNTVSLDIDVSYVSSWEDTPWTTANDNTTGENCIAYAAFSSSNTETFSLPLINGKAATPIAVASTITTQFYRVLVETITGLFAQTTLDGGGAQASEMVVFKAIPAAALSVTHYFATLMQ